MWETPLSENLQKEIVSAYERLCRPIPTNPIELLGYKISFMGEAHLRWLFGEIFMDASYFFHADNDRPLIFDCGSNIGMSVLFFKKLYRNARIIAFEPDPATFATLRQNVVQNRLSDVELHSVAIGGHSGQIELFRDPSPESSSLKMSTLRQRHDGPGVVVPSRRLSEFIKSDIDLLKLDVEGAEDAVMDELADSGKLRYVRRLHLEYHHHIDATADKLSSMLRLIEDSGFGYQLRSIAKPWPSEAVFQDISIYCYRK